jgi:SRSO17 transposase
LEKSVLEGDLHDFADPVLLHKVDETVREAFWDHLVREYHYLGYESMIGCRVKYLIALGERIVGAISFCSAAYKLGPRDTFIGWNEETRLQYLPHLLNNNRFLILPWIRIYNLASHVLSLSLSRVRTDWLEKYGKEPYLVETFVDREKFSGTSYLAANWTYLGVTKGFGRVGNTFAFHGHRKDLFVYVMSRRFKGMFQPDVSRLHNERKELLEMISGIPTHNKDILDDTGVSTFDSETFNGKLADHLTPYMKYLPRKDVHQHFVAMIKGLLSDNESKTVQGIANSFRGPDDIRNMANFMTRSKIDDNGMQNEYLTDIGGILSHPEGMITGDGCDFPKKGKNSVGVARQYCGPLGKVENCQASVMVGYASPEGYGILDFKLSMPEIWFDEEHKLLRIRTHVPEDLEYQAKNQQLLDMICNICRSGIVKAKYVGVDSAFGRDHKFLDSLPEGIIYFAAVPNNLLVFAGRPDMDVPEYCGTGRKPVHPRPSFSPRPVKDIVNDPENHWEDVVLGIGSKGPIIAKDKCIKVVEVRDGKPGKDIWLYARQLEDKSIKYYLCNESMDASKESVRAPALMRWSIEQCFKECKECLGMDHYEVRSWTGWRRHILFTLIAHLFMIKLRRLFRINIVSSCPVLIPLVPMPLDEYRKAIIQSENNMPIENPKIKSCPEQPQQVLTMGLVKILIQQFLPKSGKVLLELDFLIKQISMAFRSHVTEKYIVIRGKEGCEEKE